MSIRNCCSWVPSCCLFLGCVFGFFQSHLNGQTGGPQNSSNPNILVIYADDLGFGDVHCFHPENVKSLTPNIDRLASEGMRFTDAHSSSGVCSPSRYTLLTGRYHWRTRLKSGIVNLWGKPLIKESTPTIGTIAKSKGYKTYCVGKWHLGWDWPIAKQDRHFFRSTGYGGKKNVKSTTKQREAWNRTFSKSIPGGPTARGFDQYFGTDVPNWPPFGFLRNDKLVEIPTEYASPKLFEKNQASLQGPAVKDWKLEPILPRLAKEVVTILEKQAKSSRPFLLYLPLTSPHTPIAVNERWKGKSGLNPYADFVMETDAAVGEILDALKRLKLEKNTIVIFTSDNGFAHYVGKKELEKKGHFPSGPFRGSKSDVWEGGHRVPMIIKWSGKVQKGTVCKELVHQSDLFQTIGEILDAKFDKKTAIDSVSLLPLFKDPSKPVRRFSVSCSSRGVASIRDHQWKLILGPGSGGWTKGKVATPYQLYNLKDDPGEKNNLFQSHPKRVQQMLEQYEKIKRKVKS